MKKSLLFICLGVSALFSCSSDKDKNNDDNSSNNIVGTWDATELRINDDTASDAAKFGSEILKVLTREDCAVITLQFNEDLTAIATNSANYVEVNVNANATGIDVPCPTESDSESSTYTYDGSVVTFLDGNGQEVEVRVTVQGDVMTVNAADLEIPNFDDSGELIFQKR